MKLRLRPHHAPRFRTLQCPDDPLVTTLPICGYRQARDYTCGFATTLMVLHYFGRQVPALKLFRRLGTARDGTRQNAILRELRAAGLGANMRYDVDFARICREIDKNKLIVAYLGDTEHWLVIYGYGRQPDRVFVADPRPLEWCEHAWSTYGHRLGGFGIVCSHPSDSTAVRQRALALSPGRTNGATQGPGASGDIAHDGPPPLPVIQLRCEVQSTVSSPEEPSSAQLSFPF